MLGKLPDTVVYCIVDMMADTMLGNDRLKDKIPDTGVYAIMDMMAHTMPDTLADVIVWTEFRFRTI